MFQLQYGVIIMCLLEIAILVENYLVMIEDKIAMKISGEQNKIELDKGQK